MMSSSSSDLPFFVWSGKEEREDEGEYDEGEGEGEGGDGTRGQDDYDEQGEQAEEVKTRVCTRCSKVLAKTVIGMIDEGECTADYETPTVITLLIGRVCHACRKRQTRALGSSSSSKKKRKSDNLTSIDGGDDESFSQLNNQDTVLKKENASSLKV